MPTGFSGCKCKKSFYKHLQCSVGSAGTGESRGGGSRCQAMAGWINRRIREECEQKSIEREREEREIEGETDKCPKKGHNEIRAKSREVS